MKRGYSRKLKGKIQILSWWIYDFFYNRKMRKSLKNHKFTILSSNCIGGIIYYRLGEKFYSPTINLWMEEHDFQKFCLNIHYYLDRQLLFVESKYDYPVAHIGESNMEVTIYFRHYQSKEEAEIKWNERKKRINKKNIFVIASDNDNMSKKDLERWKDMDCKNLVVFTSSDYPDLSYTFCLKKYAGKRNIGKYVNDRNKITGLRYVETVFDFCNFINNENN